MSFFRNRRKPYAFVITITCTTIIAISVGSLSGCDTLREARTAIFGEHADGKFEFSKPSFDVQPAFAGVEISAGRENVINIEQVLDTDAMLRTNIDLVRIAGEAMSDLAPRTGFFRIVQEESFEQAKSQGVHIPYLLKVSIDYYVYTRGNVAYNLITNKQEQAKTHSFTSDREKLKAQMTIQLFKEENGLQFKAATGIGRAIRSVSSKTVATTGDNTATGTSLALDDSDQISVIKAAVYKALKDLVNQHAFTSGVKSSI